MLKILTHDETEAEIKGLFLDSDQEADIRYLIDCKNLEIVKAKELSGVDKDYELAGNDFMKRSRAELADKILQRLSAIFTDYKNAGFENSAQVTKYIMTEIETFVKN